MAIDFIERIRIASYWRKQLGEYEYVGYNPDDLQRWYIALETRGPANIRNTLIERTTRYPMAVVPGIVSEAPHPPLSIVELWLSSHERIKTGSYWIGAAAFGFFAYLAATNLHGCTILHDPNHLINNPPQMNPPIQPGSPVPVGPAASTLPNPGPAPANVASPTATPSATGSSH